MVSLFGIALGIALYWIGNTPTKQKPPASLSSLFASASSEAVILPLNIKKLWEEGVPEHIEMMKIDGSDLVLELEHLPSGGYRVCVCDEKQDVKRVMNPRASWEECERLKGMAFGDENRLLTNLKI